MVFRIVPALLVLVTLLWTGRATAQSLAEVEAAAAAKHLPTKLVREMINAGAWVVISPTTDGPHYQPGWFSGGTIYLPFAGTPLADWHRGDWSNFYNEAFSAWWGTVFMKQGAYAGERQALFNDAALRAKYNRAYPGYPQLAQEEGYSETLASIITVGYPQIQLDPATGRYTTVDVDYSTLYYRLNWTVAAVGHSDRPGYTPAAEDTYLNAAEYGYLMRWAYGRNAPAIPR